MARRSWLVGLTLVLFAAVGIGLWASSGQRSIVPRPVQWVAQVGGMEVTIVDPQGLIREVRAGAENQILGDLTTVANASEDQRQLAVQWVSLPCETRPVITLQADSGVARLTLNRDVRQLAGTCEPMAVERNITLDLTVDIPASRVQVEESD